MQNPIVGTEIEGTWKIVEKFGFGSFAMVFKAIDLFTNEMVAIKIGRLGRNEIRSNNLLKHDDHVVRMITHGTLPRYHDDRSHYSRNKFLVMELCLGGSIHELGGLKKVPFPFLETYGSADFSALPVTFLLHRGLDFVQLALNQSLPLHKRFLSPTN